MKLKMLAAFATIALASGTAYAADEMKDCCKEECCCKKDKQEPPKPEAPHSDEHPGHGKH